MSGLEEVGIAGSQALREALTTCSDPLAAIEDWQTQNGILLPSLAPALPFLDLHGVNRNEFHQSVMEELRERLISRIQELAKDNDKTKLKVLNDLLTKSFPVIKVKALRPVVMCILQQLPKIKHEYLTQILEDKELYKEAAIEVKQQIWQDNQPLFADEVSPLLQKYIDEKEALLFSHENLQQTFFSPSPKARRQSEVVQNLTKMIGRNIRLYDMVLQFLRTLFLRTRNVHYCTLRAELLMALHDLEVHDICSIDPCHKFTWCLDACIRERFVDSKRARELQAFLDGIRRGQEQVLGDLSMILCDPYAINTIALSTMRALQTSAGMEGLPRNNEEMILLMRMLSLGLRAWQMIDSQVFKEPKLETPLLTRYMPCVLAMIVDDHIHQLVAKLPDEPPPQMEPIHEVVYIASRDNAVACTILIYYVLQAAKAKDSLALVATLPVLSKCDTDIVYQDTVLHMLVSYLAQMAENFSHPEFADQILDIFFLPAISQENTLRHLMRLLWSIHKHVLAPKLMQLMEKLQPNAQHSPAVHTMYQSLKERIDSYQPSPMREPEKLDSPLMSVPAPTPAPSGHSF